MKKIKAPIDAKTFEQICALKRDNIDLQGGDWCFMVEEGMVTLTEQKIGEGPTHQVSIPRKYFDKVVRWYTTGKKSK